ncbi:hypothetical protein V5O48_000493 [Marasmius crinis-equi]|uniref:Late embryogenesis abundant protein LEA-2 subgroup domain-containing protein n=1 Tax=Marasmius crinis-equi TaxID=585013 RepID=A0ABR3G154_9AGAR
MSYRDPYAEQYGNNQYHYNTYSQQQQQYPSYGQAGPQYSDNYPTQYRDYPMEQQATTSHQNARTKDTDETSGFEQGEFTSAKENPSTIREFRRGYQGNMWTRGGKGRCIGRFFCCTILIGLFIIISIVLALALWVRPPSIVVGKAKVTNSSNLINGTGITVPMSVDISVNNPNFFSVKLNQLRADFTYPTGNVPLGNGNLNNVVFESNSQKNFTFPFAIDYKFSDDPSAGALLDIGTKCGLLGGSKSNIDIKYKITVGLRIIVANISPSISDDINFACPFGDAEIQKIKGMLPGGLGGS